MQSAVNGKVMPLFVAILCPGGTSLYELSSVQWLHKVANGQVSGANEAIRNVPCCW